MAAVASPAPFVTLSHDLASHRSINRLSMRATTVRAHQNHIYTSTRTSAYNSVQSSTNDSSDDEDLAPIKLSAEAQAILGEDNSNADSDKENAASYPEGELDAKHSLPRNHNEIQNVLRQSPALGTGSPAPRVVRVNASRPSPRTTLARDGSFMYKIHEKNANVSASAQDSKTPAARTRRIRISGSRSQTRSPSSASSHHQVVSTDVKPMGDPLSPPGGEIHTKTPRDHDDAAAAALSTVMRSQRSEDNGVHSTMRVRRIGTGTLLNRPVRRGMIRRQSEEDGEDQMGYRADEQDSPEVQQGRRAHEPDLEDTPYNMPISYGSPKQQTKQPYPAFVGARESKPSPPLLLTAQTERSPTRQQATTASAMVTKPSPASNGSHPSTQPSGSSRKPVFKIPSLPPLESANDQENEPPPTFKRPKPFVALLEIHEDDPKQLPDGNMQDAQLKAAASSPRQPLVARSNNTPHRPAPAPPPKMSLIEAATSNAGNARSKKSVHYILNGRTYRRLDCIGRGGSSRVFRIMAENYKIFALKRVNLEEADMAAIAGYKGEIDLLQKLSNVDRVIRLFDFEINEDKGVLNVMMELGESDFNKMLNEQLKGENAKLDITFTRHYWKEMLECVQSVHDYDIVHSDLKPANFLLVKGQLKLIDFGIANAIQDNTVNVHRENQIGTPNYMSPESLVCHTPAAGQVTGTKILKLGKPSDVWSLGCILYQMTYGQPPFAHISKQFERIMSIPNPKVEIKYPTTGIGGAVVPFGLIKTLRRCLQRDQTLRPTIKELLSDSDPFLNPVAISPEMLGRVIGNVVGYCRKREEGLRAQGLLGQDGQSCLPKDEEMRGWPGAFYDKLRQAQAEGTAW